MPTERSPRTSDCLVAVALSADHRHGDRSWLVPGVDQLWQRHNLKRWERWLTWQSAGKAAKFEAAKPPRR
jgi:hypothetical protein